MNCVLLVSLIVLQLVYIDQDNFQACFFNYLSRTKTQCIKHYLHVGGCLNPVLKQNLAFSHMDLTGVI